MKVLEVNRTKYHYKNDVLHRKDGPAIECSNGDKYWFINGEKHREDGPAIEFTSGYKEWYIYDKRHREDGPAIEYINGDKYWYINDKKHREDGPAVIKGKTAKWYIHGELIKETDNYIVMTKSANNCPKVVSVIDSQ
jgi:hypothetical protein